jgi:hypothetical protein
MIKAKIKFKPAESLLEKMRIAYTHYYKDKLTIQDIKDAMTELYFYGETKKTIQKYK